MQLEAFMFCWCWEGSVALRLRQWVWSLGFVPFLGLCHMAPATNLQPKLHHRTVDFSLRLSLQTPSVQSPNVHSCGKLILFGI